MLNFNFPSYLEVLDNFKCYHRNNRSQTLISQGLYYFFKLQSTSEDLLDTENFKCWPNSFWFMGQSKSARNGSCNYTQWPVRRLALFFPDFTGTLPCVWIIIFYSNVTVLQLGIFCFSTKLFCLNIMIVTLCINRFDFSVLLRIIINSNLVKSYRKNRGC